MSSKQSLLSLLVCLLVILSCSTKGNRTVYLRPLEGSMDAVQVKFHHLSNDTTRVYYSIPSQYIVCMKDPQTLRFQGRANVKCSFYDESQPPKQLFVADYTVVVDTVEVPLYAFTGAFDVVLPYGRDYLVKTVVSDAKSPQKTSNLTVVDKKQKYSPSLFLLRDRNEDVMFDNFTCADDSVSVNVEMGYVPQIYVTRYNSEVKYPAPAYIIGSGEQERFKRDTTFVVKNGEKVVFSPQGLYILRIDTMDRRGYCLLSSYKGYPMITQKHALITPLRYICSDEQFNSLRYSPTEKLSAERFWIDAGGSLSDAQRLIRAFYGRAEYANRYFSTYKEGVMTDQGMIYVLYGAPAKVYTAADSQRWVYGREASGMEVSFVFRREDNPFSTEVFVLDRNLNKKNIWSSAVSAWREGTVFDNNEIIKLQDEYDRQRYYDSYGIWY
ncbi:MAG: GWxTD domain-containing protein [Flavobacteriales bacterium]|nr:GWxTD domain-containing protein [Flavobacteriales bacterium]